MLLKRPFFWETSYVAKNLWRDELFPAKYSFEVVMKLELLLKMLQWVAGVNTNWTAKAGNLGKGLKKHLTDEQWARLEASFAGADIEDNWKAFLSSISLFRDSATLVAEQLALTYPHDLDSSVMVYLKGIRSLPKT